MTSLWENYKDAGLMLFEAVNAEYRLSFCGRELQAFISFVTVFIPECNQQFQSLPIPNGYLPQTSKRGC